MKRIITVALVTGLALACGDQNKQSVADRASNAAQAMRDSATAVGKAAVDSAAAAGGTMIDSARSKAGRMMDSAKAMATSAKESAKAAGERVVDKARTTASEGTLALDNARMNLTKDQVQQLQTALTNDGCDAGTADGVVGRKTRDAMACSMKKHDVAKGDAKGLYKALGLDF